MNPVLDSLLNISIQVDKDVRELFPELMMGYNPDNNTWEIVIKAVNGSDGVRQLRDEFKELEFEELLCGYAITYANELTISRLLESNNVLAVEKPRFLFSQLYESKGITCVNRLKQGEYNLTGEGVLVGIIDTDFNEMDEEFLDASGKSRVIAKLDLSDLGNSFHGQDVATICCGKSGVASGSEIIAVSLGGAIGDFTRTTNLMRGIDFCMNKSIELSKPIAINISYGSNYGAHDGNSLLENYIDEVSLLGKSIFCIGSGNEGSGRNHKGGTIAPYQSEEIYFAIGDYEKILDIQIWYQMQYQCEIELVKPDGELLCNIYGQSEVRYEERGNDHCFYYSGVNGLQNIKNLAYIGLFGDKDYITAGVWLIRIKNASDITMTYNIWLPQGNSISNSTGFLKPEKDNTFTIPGTAFNPLCVGAINTKLSSIATFSGRGNIIDNGISDVSKPDVVAPGVGIEVNKRSVTGTSFATPFVTGTCALLMEWGIVRGNDTEVYGERLKGMITGGADRNIGISDKTWPDNTFGWGLLCGYRSIFIN